MVGRRTNERQKRPVKEEQWPEGQTDMHKLDDMIDRLSNNDPRDRRMWSNKNMVEWVIDNEKGQLSKGGMASQEHSLWHAEKRSWRFEWAIKKVNSQETK